MLNLKKADLSCLAYLLAFAYGLSQARIAVLTLNPYSKMPGGILRGGGNKRRDQNELGGSLVWSPDTFILIPKWQISKGVESYTHQMDERFSGIDCLTNSD